MSYINKIQKNNVNYDIQDARVPEVGASDKDKVLHTNATTGALEWAQGGGGGTGGSSIYEHYVPLYGDTDPETGEAPVVCLYFTNAYPGLYLDPESGEFMLDNLMQDLENEAIAALPSTSKLGLYVALAAYVIDTETGDGQLQMRSTYYPALGVSFEPNAETGETLVTYLVLGAEQSGQSIVPAILTDGFSIAGVLDGQEEVFSDRYDPAEYPEQYHPSESEQESEGE